MNLIRGFLCWLLDHKWRRLHKGELVSETATNATPRICARCGATRFAKMRNRKPKEQTQ